MQREIVVVDYGLGNLYSVARAVEHCGANPIVSGDPDLVCNASKVILPGVGAFGRGMAALSESGLDQAVKEVVNRGNALLGICLGMQMLLDTSEEFGEQRGLGLIPGKVVEIPRVRADGLPIKVPHIGWNELLPVEGGCPWVGSPLSMLEPCSAMYFVHSYMAMPSDRFHRVADCVYEGIAVSAVIGRDNVWGMQFHPEKSGRAGLRVLQKYIASP